MVETFTLRHIAAAVGHSNIRETRESSVQWHRKNRRQHIVELPDERQPEDDAMIPEVGPPGDVPKKRLTVSLCSELAVRQPRRCISL